MWKEFKGSITPRTPDCNITVARKIGIETQLQNGQEVVLSEKRSGLFRRLDSKISIKILDDDHALFSVYRPHESTLINVGAIQSSGDTFGFAAIPYERQNGKNTSIESHKVTKQDVWIGSLNNVHGIFWTSTKGEKVKPKIITKFRSYYDGEEIPDTLRQP